MPLNEDWEREAANWIAWARTPRDVYWRYRECFFELLPARGRATLEIGCGEGRVARDLAIRGHRITAVDAAPTLLRAARAADPTGEYVLADAAELPFEDGSFDLVVAYNSLMDMEDMPRAVCEAYRVLEPCGRLGVCVTHPVSDAGQFAGLDPNAPFVIEETYFGRRWFEGTFQRDGLTMTFHGWSNSLEEYARALERPGFVVEAIREPRLEPAAGDGEDDPADERWRRIPMFLMLRALKPASPGAAAGD